jgi:hypothetical protein
MHKLLALGLALPLAACIVGSGTDTPDPGSGNNPTGPGDEHGDPVPGSGSGTTDTPVPTGTIWSGVTTVNNTTTVPAGSLLTIAAGATVNFGPQGALVVNGTLDMAGVKGQLVTLAPSAKGGFYAGLTVNTGGQLKMNYVVQTGAELLVNGGTITVTNTRMSNASHDLLVVNSGTVDMSYSAIGLEPGGAADTTHCDMHFGGPAVNIKVTHSNISTSVYGLMLYGGNNVDLTYNNWFSNPTQIDTTAQVSANISNGWFDGTAPTAVPGSTLTYQNPSPGRLPAAMAGPQ